VIQPEGHAAANHNTMRTHRGNLLYLVEQPRDLGQVPADELRVKKQGGLVWMAMAMMVQTRLWLGGTSSPYM